MTITATPPAAPATPAAPAAPAATGQDRRTSLSPSRAGDFQTCPLLYRFRHVDRLPEPPGREAYRGTLVHAVLERLFDLPAGQRTLQQAEALLPSQWATLLSESVAGRDLLDLLFGPADNWQRSLAGEQLEPHDPAAVVSFLLGAAERLATYFELENPAALEPAERELAVSATVAGGLHLRGFVDRLDRAPDGRTRVVDYKTGRAPREAFEQQAMFQLRCYGLALWRGEGAVPTLLQLLYLGDGQVLSYRPEESDLLATERKLAALWQAILRAYEHDDFRPRPSGMCRFCSFQALCPAWDDSAPPQDPPRGPTTVVS